jgi:hypothetical protein
MIRKVALGMKRNVKRIIKVYSKKKITKKPVSWWPK